jgi:hypothetical protein
MYIDVQNFPHQHDTHLLTSLFFCCLSLLMKYRHVGVMVLRTLFLTTESLKIVEVIFLRFRFRRSKKHNMK